jgi:large subunit ribosomal protein L10
MPTQRKIDAVADLTEKMSRMQLAVVADYRGLNVSEISNLRSKLREHGAEMIVAKNTLLRIAARESGYESLEPLLEGPTAITFAYDDVAKVAKALHDYVSSSSKVSVRGGLLGTSIFQADGLEDVSKMPSREEVLSQIVGGIQSPLAGVVGVIGAPVNDVVNIVNTVVVDVASVLQARIDKLQAESSGESASAA